MLSARQLDADRFAAKERKDSKDERSRAAAGGARRCGR